MHISPICPHPLPCRKGQYTVLYPYSRFISNIFYDFLGFDSCRKIVSHTVELTGSQTHRGNPKTQSATLVRVLDKECKQWMENTTSKWRMQHKEGDCRMLCLNGECNSSMKNAILSWKMKFANNTRIEKMQSWTEQNFPNGECGSWRRDRTP